MEYFSVKKEAEKRASEKAADFDANGTAGLDITPELRLMAIQCESVLAPFKKTLNDATLHYKAFLEAEAKKQQSRPGP